MKNLALVLVAVAAGAAGGFLGASLQGDAAPTRSAARPAAEIRVADLPPEVRNLEARVRALEDAPRPAPAPTARPGRGPGALPQGAAPEGEEAVPPEDLLDGLLDGPFDHRNANRLFGRLFPRPDRIDGVIARLQKEIEKDPKNAELQVALATSFVAKLTSMPQGPQQGLIWMQASAAYDKAIELVPGHWQARFGKAFGTSMAPEFLGMRPQAIRQFEELLQIQESQAVAPEHANTYYRLGTLYKDAGNTEKAREMWDRGRKSFPNNVSLKEALDLLEGR